MRKVLFLFTFFVISLSTISCNLIQETGTAYNEPKVEGANLIHHFEFNNTLEDSLDTSVNLIEHSNTNSSGFGSGYWWWKAESHPGGGLILHTDLISDPQTYSLGFSINFEQTGPSWIKILSFKDENDDNGFYFYDNGLQLYPFDVNKEVLFSSGVYYDFILSRSTDKTVTVYIVESDRTLTKVYEHKDESDQTVPIIVDGKYQFVFFTDDYITTNEWTTGGSLRSLRVWDGAIENVKP